MATRKKILKLHDDLMVLSRKEFNATSQGKELDEGTGTFRKELFTWLGDWEDVLAVRKEALGDQFLMFDAAPTETSFEGVSEMCAKQDVDYERGPYVGPFKMETWEYFNGSPPSLVLNGEDHRKARSVVWDSQPKPAERGDWLSRICVQVLSGAVKGRRLSLGKETQRGLLDALHQMFFGLELSKLELVEGTQYANSIPVPALPDWVGAMPSAACKAYAERTAHAYTLAPGFERAQQAGAKVGWDPMTTARALFGTVHLASMPACAALTSSVIGRILKHGLGEQLRAKYDAIVGADGYLDQTDVDGVELLRKIILETARLHAPVRTVNPVPKQAKAAAIGQDICPFHAGKRWTANLHAANHDARRWEHPERFDLSRDFDDVLSWNGSGGTRTEGRDCTGKELSIQLISTWVLCLFGRWTWKPIDPDVIVWDGKRFGPNRPKRLPTKCELVLRGVKER